MSRKWVIVITTYHLGIDDFRDVWEALVLEHSLNILSVFRKACSSECFRFLVFVLKFGQLQSYASDFGNIRTVLSNLASKKVLELVKLGQDSCSVYKDLVERGQTTH